MMRAELVNNPKFPERNVRALEKAMDKAGWVNPYLRVAVLSTVAKESGFKPKNEYSYRNTSNSRIRSLFGKRLADYSDSQLTKLKQNDVAFYDAIYGGRYGNKDAGDGFKYRGRGFNQLTFRDSYEKYAKLTGHKIDKNPDLLNDIDVASDVLIAFLGNRLSSIPNESRFPVKNPNEFKDMDTAIYTVVSANAGWGKDVRQSHPETLTKAQNYSSVFQYPKELYEKFKKYGVKGIASSFGYDPFSFAKRNWIPITILFVGLGIGGFFLIKRIWK